MSVMHGDHSESKSCLVVLLDEQRILIDLSHIALVIHVAQLQEIPHKDPAFEGMLNYHGDSIPIYHLSRLIDTSAAAQYALDMPIILCDCMGKRFGLLATQALDIIQLRQEQIQKDAILQALPFIEGVVELADGSVWLLGLECLMRPHLDQIGMVS